MNDLIRRQDVIKKIVGLNMQVYEGNRCVGTRTYLTKEEVIYAIDELPSTEPEMKWIPVTEALPINDVDVIVSVLDDSGDTPYRFTSVGWCTPNGQYWVVDNEICYGVIAWMPLPKPAKIGDEK